MYFHEEINKHRTKDINISIREHILCVFIQHNVSTLITLYSGLQTTLKNDKLSSGYFPGSLSIKSRRFGTLCRFHFQQAVKCESLHHLLKMELTQCSETSVFNTQTPGKYFTTCWRWNRHSVPKRRLLILRRRGNTSPPVEDGTDTVFRNVGF